MGYYFFFRPMYYASFLIPFVFSFNCYRVIIFNWNPWDNIYIVCQKKVMCLVFKINLWCLSASMMSSLNIFSTLASNVTNMTEVFDL